MVQNVKWERAAAGVWVALGAMLLSGGAYASESLRVTIDKNHILRTDRPVETIIVGNPHIADVSAQSNQLLFVLGRTSGETNILGFDKEGNVVFDKDVTVVPHNARTVTLHRAGASETFACAPRCEATLRAGDDIVKFEPLSKEVETVVKFANGQASSANKGGE